MFIHVLIRHAKGAFLPRLRDNTCKDALIIIVVSTYNVFQMFSFPRLCLWGKMSIFVKYIYILRRPQNFGKSPHYILLSYVLPVQSKVKISQNFVAFSEYMNFTKEVVNVLQTVNGIWNFCLICQNQFDSKLFFIFFFNITAFWFLKTL